MFVCASVSAFAKEDALLNTFRSPPPSARPEVWWHWMNGNVSREGIVADLDAMAAVGIGGVTQHLQPVGAFSHQRTQSHGNGQSHHVCARDAHPHCIFQDVGTEQRLNFRGGAPQRFGGFRHTERHRHRFRTPNGRHHFSLHQRNNLLSFLLINHIKEWMELVVVGRNSYE